MNTAKKPRNFREYKVWQEAVALSSYIYQCTEKMPYFEQKGLCDQLQRAVVSISSNIAEGAAKPTDAGFATFLDNALGSAYEVEPTLSRIQYLNLFNIIEAQGGRRSQTQLLISHNIGYINKETYNEILPKVQHIEVQITRLSQSIRSTKPQS